MTTARFGCLSRKYAFRRSASASVCSVKTCGRAAPSKSTARGRAPVATTSLSYRMRSPLSAPSSRTTISRVGSMRRARAAALRPAATPPITNSRMRRLFLFFHLLDKVQDIERLDGPVGKEAVHGILLIGKQIENRGELGHDQ